MKKEFSIQEGDTTIVYVSRMDQDRAMVAQQLIEITPQLEQEIKGLRIIIAGGGDVYHTLKAKAENVNSVLGRECISMPGSRTDINELISVADLFVGVSRAALEAMASGKPVIVAGNEGYIGLLSLIHI